MAKTSNIYKILIFTLFLLSLSLRFGIVKYNRWSNDDHTPVVEYILKTGQLPEKPDCWECFQPKFFYFASAKLLELPWVGDALLEMGLPKALGRINFYAGLVTLFVMGVFITNLPVKSETYKLLSFGLLALNPKLIGINSQATNDTFAILFSTVALYCTFLFLQKQKPGTFLLMILFVLLGISSKTNTWVTFIAIAMALFIKAWIQIKETTRPLLVGIFFVITILSLSIFNPLNQYITNYQKYGSPTLTNIEKQPFPSFFKQTIADRPGILSIYDGFFTFKFFNLLQHPLVDNGDVYAPHRTSLWTQLYGRAHSVHFDNWPKMWMSKDTHNFARTRVIYILALLPTALLLFGFFIQLYQFIRSILKSEITILSKQNYGLGLITFIGYLLLIILYLLMYRRFSSMKVIFIYPALLWYPGFFMSALEFLKVRLFSRYPWIWIGFIIWIVLLLALYSLDVYAMAELIYSRVK